MKRGARKAAIAELQKIPDGPERETRIAELARVAGESEASIRAELEGRTGVRLKTIRADDVQPQAVTWLWRPRIPIGKLALLVGDPAAGKSTIATAIAAAVTQGCPLPGDTAVSGPADVLMISAEDGLADTIRPRLEAAGADLKRAHLVEFLESGGESDHLALKKADHLAAIESRIEELRPILVVIDPLTAYLGDTDSYEDAKVRAVLAPLAKLAERRECALLAIMHLRKAGADRALHRVSGSIAFAAAARSVLLAGCEPDNPEIRALVHIKSNLAKDAPPEGYRLIGRGLPGGIEAAVVEWTGTSDLTADRILAKGEGQGAGPREEATQFLREELAGGRVEATVIAQRADRLGIAERTLKRAKSDLRIEAIKEGFGDGSRWYWRLPAKEGHAPRPSSGTESLAFYDQSPSHQGDSSVEQAIEGQYKHVTPFEEL